MTICSRFRHLTLAAAALMATAAPSARAADPVSYNRDVRPIFSDTCFKCHGPDAARRKGNLRLDLPESAFAKAKSGDVAIVPGFPDQSALIKRVTTKDEDDLMPPPGEHKALRPADVDVMRRWIAEGAKYEGHWSFSKIVAPAPPRSPHKSPIDAFVAARLEREGLTFSPEEEKARLIRRATLDLTGLPPAIADVDAFLADSAPNAFEKVVDRLLASPHFGERMAVPWLDLARHSDTAGYHNDSLRTTWMWRDWVVKSFNDNKPFDRFTVEQIAGDLLPNSTVENKLASGFMRNVMTSDEGGIIPEEYLNLYVVDRVSTLGTTWLGLTTACAQCHDHKYDPITQKDFYSLYAFFNNVPEQGKDGVRDRNPEPKLVIATPEQQGRLAKFDADAKATELAIAEIAKSLDARQAEWEQQIAALPEGEMPAGPWAAFPLDHDGDGVDDAGRPIEASEVGLPVFGPGRVNKAFRADGQRSFNYARQFAFDNNRPFAVAAWVKVRAPGGSPFGTMDATPNLRGWDVEFHGTKMSVHLSSKWPDNAIHVQVEKDLVAESMTHVAFSYDGSGKAAGLQVFVNGVQAKTATLRDNLTGTIKSDAPFSIGRRGGAAVPFNGSIDDVRIYSRALSATELATLGGAPTLALVKTPIKKRSAAQNETLKKFFRETVATDYAAAQQKLLDLKRDKAAYEKDVPNAMVMVEMPKPRDTFLKLRGQYDKNGEKVTANTPHFLPALSGMVSSADHAPNRLDLANWLVSPDHPLTARVEINRLWATIFGTGLVKTLNDFGSQGEWPSHPELLDYLAADFQKDWDIKRAIKQMVLSQTYRQTARATPDLIARDTANRLLARGPRNRLDAEFVRDNALAISGLYNPEIGGKPVFPIQPPGIWEVNEMAGGGWKQQHDAGQYRRAMYIYHRRSTPYPSLLTFDAPNREVCTAMRARSSTPLQSLVLMNDPVFVEAARGLAQRTLSECPDAADPAKRLAHLWRLALARPIEAPQRAILEKTLQRQLEKYKKDKPAAEALTKVGDLPRPSNADPGELAAWTAVANVILNLNETISN